MNRWKNCANSVKNRDNRGSTERIRVCRFDPILIYVQAGNSGEIHLSAKHSEAISRLSGGSSFAFPRYKSYRKAKVLIQNAGSVTHAK